MIKVSSSCRGIYLKSLRYRLIWYLYSDILDIPDKTVSERINYFLVNLHWPNQVRWVYNVKSMWECILGSSWKSLELIREYCNM